MSLRDLFRKPAFTVHPKEIVGDVGDAVKLTVNRPAKFELRWRDTQDKGTARVDLSGQVLLVGPGTAVIRVREQDGDWDKDYIDVPLTIRGVRRLDDGPIGATTTYTHPLEARVAELERWRGKHEGAMHP